MSNRIKTVLKIVVTVALLVLMFYFAGIGNVLDTIANADPVYIILAFTLIFIGSLVAAYRWYTVMHTLDFEGSVSFYTRSYLRGIFLNQLLPSSIGGDTIRVLDVAELGYKKRHALIGVILDRGLGIYGILLVNIIFLNFTTPLLPYSLWLVLNAICVVGIVGFFVFAYIHKLKFLEKIKYAELLIQPSSSMLRVIGNWNKLSVQTILTVSVHILTFAGVFFIAHALGVELPVSTFMIIMPPVILLTIIPISLAGWGIREGAMVGLLAFANVSSSDAIAISILFGFSYILQGIIGAYFWFKSNKKGK